jgi:hypothetical protein
MGLSPNKFMPMLDVHNTINSDSAKQRSFVAPFYAAGYGQRPVSADVYDLIANIKWLL